MKLIINIPENEYKHIKEYYEKNDTVEATYSYIYHGIPLEQIRAEIEAARYGLINDGLDVALRIIDKHMGGK